jgi:hypothetical protein
MQDGKLTFDPDRLPFAQREWLIPNFKPVMEARPDVLGYGFEVYQDRTTVTLEVETLAGRKRIDFQPEDVLIAKTIKPEQIVESALRQ